MKRTLRFLVLGLLSLAVLFPVYIALMNSFKPLGKILGNVLEIPGTLTLKNYLHVIDAANYLTAFLNTLIITVMAVSISILVSAMSSYWLSRAGSKFTDFLVTLFAVSMLVPFQTIMLPLVKVTSFLHLSDSIPGLILVMVPLFSPFAILTYHGFVKSVPRELDEAAEIDGAGRVRTFFQIIFPMMGPVTASLVVIYALWAWNDFALPLVLLSSTGNKTVTLVTFVYYSSQSMRWDYILAALSMAALPVVFFYAIMQRYIIRGIADGAIKG